MSETRIVPSIEALPETLNATLGPSRWVEIPQDKIAAFAEATGDDQWIHVDVERATKEGPFGGPIAHGYLTLALAPMLLQELIHVEGCSRIINSGMDGVKFKAPVRAGARVRLVATVDRVKVIRGQMAHTTLGAKFEIENETKPALIGSLTYVYFRD